MSRDALVIDWLSDDALAELLRHGEHCRDLFGHPDLVRELRRRMAQAPAEALWYRPVAVLLDGEAVAAGGFKGPPVRGAVEIGYRVAPAWRHHGLARALVSWLCQQAVRQGITTVLAVTAADNRSSQAVLVACGFVHHGDVLSDSQQWLQRWRYGATSSTPSQP